MNCVPLVLVLQNHRLMYILLTVALQL